MIKKKNAMCGIAVAVVVLVLWIMFTPKALGNINASVSEQTTSMSEISFVADAGERVKFSFQSNIKCGDLEIIVYTSEGEEIYVLDHARELETFFTFEHSDKYILRAEYEDFVGDFKVAVYPA